MENRIEITISKTNEGNISVNTKTADGVTDSEVGQLAMDFIESLAPTFDTAEKFNGIYQKHVPDI